MRYKLFSLTILLGVIAAQANAQINLLRYNDNFAYLRTDSSKRKGTDKIKHMVLWKGTDISFGGDLREQMQYYRNNNFGDMQSGEADMWQLWHRLMAHSNLEIGKKVRLFAQVGSTFRFFNPGPLTPEIDENKLSLHQAFVDYHWGRNWLASIGRQEVTYGNNRILTFREGPNTRLAFDAASIRYRSEKRRVDVFAMKPVISEPGLFDDKRACDVVMGIYGTEIFKTYKLGLDYYFLNYSTDRRKYNYISGTENRQSYGLRVFSKKTRLNYELEATYQSGLFNNLRINAYSFSGDISQVLVTKKLTLGLAGNYASGDRNRNDKELNTYNFMFSKPQYGLTAPIGASNIVNINPYLTLMPVKAMHVNIGTYFMWRESTQDGTYSPLAKEMRPNLHLLYSSVNKRIGTLLNLESAYTVNKNISLGFDAGYFVPGSYVKETGKGKSIYYSSFKIGMKL